MKNYSKIGDIEIDHFGDLYIFIRLLRDSIMYQRNAQQIFFEIERFEIFRLSKLVSDYEILIGETNGCWGDKSIGDDLKAVNME